MSIWFWLGMIIVAVLLAGCIGVGNYFYNLALNPAKDKSFVFKAPHNAIDTQAGRNDSHHQWFEQAEVADQYIESSDGLKLHAYKILQPITTNKWAILAHGYTSEAAAMKSPAMQLYKAGFHILMPDARGHGSSEGRYIGMGWPDRLDLLRWIDSILLDYPQAEIVLYGVSMGGATVMMVSGESLPAQVKVIVEDCGYTSAKEEFSYQLKALFRLPSFPLIPLASLIARIRAGYTLGQANALAQVAKAKIPIMFIHGDCDTFVPSKMVHEVYEAAKTDKEIYIVPGAGHAGAASVAGEEYWRKVTSFIHKYVK